METVKSNKRAFIVSSFLLSKFSFLDGVEEGGLEVEEASSVLGGKSVYRGKNWRDLLLGLEVVSKKLTGFTQFDSGFITFVVAQHWFVLERNWIEERNTA
jgi:hypothetical protein